MTIRSIAYLAALVLLKLSPPASAATYASIVCEALLTTGLEKIAVQESPLLPIRDFRFLVESTVPAAKSAGAGCKSFEVYRPLKNLPRKKAQAMIERLNAIEEQVAENRVDSQIVLYQIRGQESIQKAVTQLSQRVTALKEEYKALHQELMSPGRELTQHIYQATFLGTFVLMGLDITELLNGVTPKTALDAGTSALILYINRSNLAGIFTDTVQRKDYAQGRVWQAAQSLRQGTVFMRSQNLIIPTEFHQMMMQNDQDADSVEHARRLGILSLDEFRIPKILRILSKSWREEDLARRARMAGDINRHVYIDHIGWYDEATNEPVWTIVYRAFKERPTPRKPPKKVRSEDRQAEESWQPGALNPIPVTGR